MAKTREQQIDEMVDREAIRDLAVRYCDHIWRDEVDAVGAFFTADGVFINNPPPGLRWPPRRPTAGKRSSRCSRRG